MTTRHFTWTFKRNRCSCKWLWAAFNFLGHRFGGPKPVLRCDDTTRAADAPRFGADGAFGRAREAEGVHQAERARSAQALQNQAISHDLQNQGLNLNANNEENIEDVNAIDHQLRAAYFMEKNA